MLRAEVGAWVFRTVSGSFKKEEMDAALQALNLFLDLNDGVISEEISITEMAEASDMQKPQRIRNFTEIERFMKDLCEIVNPELMKHYPQPLNASNREWMLGNMYREAFKVLPESVKTGTSPERYRGDKNYIDHYLRVYQFRNALIHDPDADLSMVNLQTMIVSTLVVKMDLCYKNADALRKAYQVKRRREGFDGKTFSKRIVELYKYEETHGFGYVDVHWTEENSGDKGYSIKKLLERQGLNRVKFLGEAGSGKSTALRRIEYILANQYNGKAMKQLPIYVELGNLSDGENILLGRIASVMGIDERLAEDFLKSGELCLLMDGYNEVLDTALKRKVSKELDYMSNAYPESRIFLTDRAISRASIPTMYYAKKLYLYPMDMEDRRKYFESNCQDMDCRQMLLQKIQEDPEYFEFLDTPLKLKQLLHVVLHKRELPEDITNDYIEYLMEREQLEKKDENIEYLPTFLQALAILQQEQVTERDALVQMAKCKEAFGFSLPDTRQCLKLAVDMGLLIYEDKHTINFANRVYQEYFFMEGLANQLDELL